MAAQADRPAFRPALAPVHVALACALGFGLPLLAGIMVEASPRAPPPGSWIWLYEQHGLQALLALAAIGALRTVLPTDFGLHWPRGRSYVGLGAVGGLAFGAVSCLALLMITGKPPALGFAPTPANMAGWLSFETLYVGPTEEVLFRALLVTWLAAALLAKLRLGRVDLSIGGVVAALIFALSHRGYGNAPVALALAQQAYAFGLGLLYAFCFEKSGSLLAPIVAHNLSDGVVTIVALGAFLLAH
ncbi:MAG: CPBP family glutamic-type intramembrane protease [Caulobacteraceae bacterium]